MRRRLRFPLVAVLILLTGFGFSGCSASDDSGRSATQEEAWVGTWGTAPQLTEPRNLPPEPGLSNNTLRQIVHVSQGGERLRMHLSNVFGTDPVTIAAVRLANSMGGSSIDVATETALTFEGQSEVTIPAGEAVTSDAFDYSLTPLSNVAITILFGGTSADVTGHPGSRTTSYLKAGDALDEGEMTTAEQTDHWYIITGIDVMVPRAAAVVTLGNSITDGRGSGTNKQNRWPDELARRLMASPETSHIAMLNMGIGGNCVVRACLGPSALDRFERDVLDRAGVRWLIVLEGVNDIGNARGADSSAAVAQQLIAAYQQMAEWARAADIRIYGATILPFGGSFYDTPDHEAARITVNEWIRTSGAFDAVIDLDMALRDPENPTMLQAESDTGDHLHPNEVGYVNMAAAIDLALFQDSPRLEE